MGYTEQELEDNFRYQIDFLNPRGLKFNEYRISLSDFDITEVPLSENIQFDEIGTVILNPPTTDWSNGTYTARLYEVNRTTQEKALIADTQYKVINESSKETGTTIEEDKARPDSFGDLYNNDYFIALMLVLVGGMGLGIVAGLTGMISGVCAGTFIGFMLGYVPIWFVILMVFAIVVGVASISRQVITGGGGNQ